MKIDSTQRATGYALMAATVIAYFSRPWSCGYTLSQFAPTDSVSYAHFDYHGLGVISAWLAAIIFAAPIIWLASKVFLNRSAKFGVFGRGPNGKTTALSFVIALALGAPMYSQLSYLIGLPLTASTPVVISSLAWFLLVEICRTGAVVGNLLDKRAVRIAAAVAMLVTVPKLALIGFVAVT